MWDKITYPCLNCWYPFWGPFCHMDDSFGALVVNSKHGLSISGLGNYLSMSKLVLPLLGPLWENVWLIWGMNNWFPAWIFNFLARKVRDKITYPCLNCWYPFWGPLWRMDDEFGAWEVSLKHGWWIDSPGNYLSMSKLLLGACMINWRYE